MFNALHGASRLNFHDPARDRPLDVLLDRFVMAHELDLRDSASPDGLTIALADLLMTKLQVVNINEKDVRDLLALLLDHEFGARWRSAAADPRGDQERLGAGAHHPPQPGDRVRAGRAFGLPTDQPDSVRPDR